MVYGEKTYTLRLTKTGVTNISAVVSYARKSMTSSGKLHVPILPNRCFDTIEQKFVGKVGATFTLCHRCIYAFTMPPSGRPELVLLVAHGQKGKEKEEKSLSFRH
jgi:hypothetical protein